MQMAYDPNDPKDVEVVEGLVAEKLEEHTSGLKATIEKLKGEKKKLQANGNDPAALERLENELETTKETLTKVQGDLKTATKERDKATKGLETESAFTRNLLIDNGLTDALVKAKIATNLMPGAKALLQSKVQLITEGDKRVAKVGDKLLGDFVNEWSQSDEGKSYVVAPSNNGGGANGGGANGSGGKSVTRAVWNDMDHVARATHSKENGTVTD